MLQCTESGKVNQIITILHQVFYIIWSHGISWPPKFKCANMYILLNCEILIPQILKHGIKWLEKNYLFEKNITFSWKSQFIMSLKIWWSMAGIVIFNDFILSGILLHQWRHRSFNLATTESSNVLLSPLAECRLDDVTLTSLWRHSCYDDIYMMSFV